MTSGLKRNKDETMDDCWFAKKYDDSNHYIDTMNKEQLEKTALVFGTVEDMHKQLEQSFNVPEGLKEFISSGGNLFACGTCLELRQQEAGICPISTMSQLVEIITDSDKVVTFG